MNPPSCIKIPGSKETLICPNLTVSDVDIRDQCTKNDLISLANEIFGTNKWNHTVTSQTLDFVEYTTGKYQVGCAAFVKIQLRDGTVHEDVGYSNLEGPNKGLIIFLARTGSITNAMKNTLLCFGGDIATKIRNFTKPKTESSVSTISHIGEPQKMVPPLLRMTPNAQSTPHKTPSPRCDIQATTFNYDNREVLSVSNNEEPKIQSPKPLHPVESCVKVDKAAMTEEERRLERKRKQAQKQEEYKRLLKETAYGQKPNPRF
ncbi:DNA repair protein RAD52 homolog [Neodiprion fabricii]|uniref:DNA repair protein RAD52 homolog n=1 Tax=Neodiprion fabricii TaxID=2872261 RepID=UPI001ED9528D|nr:DNA repair protein RAD52 homolog [Neodiprion fabricii]